MHCPRLCASGLALHSGNSPARLGHERLFSLSWDRESRPCDRNRGILRSCPYQRETSLEGKVVEVTLSDIMENVRQGHRRNQVDGGHAPEGLEPLYYFEAVGLLIVVQGSLHRGS